MSRVYKYTCVHLMIEDIKNEFEVFKSLAYREGYRIEVEKIVRPYFSVHPLIYYCYVPDGEIFGIVKKSS